LLGELADKERGDRIRDRRDELHLTQPAVVELLEAAAWQLPESHELHPRTAGKNAKPPKPQKAPVTLRGYQSYEGGGGIVWEKAKLLAQVLQMDVRVMMSGDERAAPAPDPFAKRRQEDAPVDVRLDAVEGALAQILTAMSAQLGAQTDTLATMNAQRSAGR
jgi:hypothetical protein